MQTTPKILKAQSFSDRTIEITFENGLVGKFNFESYFDYTGHYAFLSDLSYFCNIKVNSNGHFLFWLNEHGEEVEIDPAILYAICTQKQLVVDNKVVFDPSLGKNAWL